MEIGTDDLDFMDDEYGIEEVQHTTTQDSDDEYINDSSSDEQGISNSGLEEDDLILELLKSKGIEDKSKIKFENDEGEIEEIDWDSLSNSDKFNILNSSVDDSNSELDDSEIELINIIRQSKLTPHEYIQAVQNMSVNNYIRESQTPTYSVDQISDDELFVMNLLAQVPDLTNEEAYEALDKAKQNENLFKKLIGAIRTEYINSEQESFRYNEMRQQQEAQEQFNQFAESIENQILNFTEFSGYDLNMEDEDMQELYDFITGFDAAGNSHFGKALNDPETLVKMAWFALNGEQMINDISEYYKKEIANVRKESYNKGVLAKDKPKVVHKQIQSKVNKSDYYDDLD